MIMKQIKNSLLNRLIHGKKILYHKQIKQINQNQKTGI